MFIAGHITFHNDIQIQHAFYRLLLYINIQEVISLHGIKHFRSREEKRFLHSLSSARWQGIYLPVLFIFLHANYREGGLNCWQV